MIGERLREARKELKLSRDKFGERVGVRRDVVANMELGRVDMSQKDLLLDLICSTYNINCTWLKTGAGKMFDEPPVGVQLRGWADTSLPGETEEFKERLIDLLCRLDKDNWMALVNKAVEMVKAKENPALEKTKTSKQGETSWEREARLLEAEAAAIRNGGQECSALPPAKDT